MYARGCRHVCETSYRRDSFEQPAHARAAKSRGKQNWFCSAIMSFATAALVREPRSSTRSSYTLKPEGIGTPPFGHCDRLLTSPDQIGLRLTFGPRRSPREEVAWVFLLSLSRLGRGSACDGVARLRAGGRTSAMYRLSMLRAAFVTVYKLACFTGGIAPSQAVDRSATPHHLRQPMLAVCPQLRRAELVNHVHGFHT